MKLFYLPKHLGAAQDTSSSLLVFDPAGAVRGPSAGGSGIHPGQQLSSPRAEKKTGSRKIGI